MTTVSNEKVMAAWNQGFFSEALAPDLERGFDHINERYRVGRGAPLDLK
jgi:hypothetical protein